MKKRILIIISIVLALFLTSCVFENKTPDPIVIPKIENVIYVGTNENRKEYLISYSDGSTQLINIESNEGSNPPNFTFEDLYEAAISSGFDGSMMDFIGEFIQSDLQTNNIAAITKGLKSSVSIFANFKRTETSGQSWNQSSSNIVEYASAGSGIIYKLDKNSGSAYIITNYHVVSDAKSNTINKVSDDIEIYLYGLELLDYKIEATYIGGSETHDIAVLKVINSEVLKNSLAEPVNIGNSDDAKVGDTAIAIGNPEARGISATLGIISVESEYVSIKSGDDVVTTYRVMRVDTAINSGNSGGGLFNSLGEVIGIVNAKMIDTTIESIGYAIPSNIVFAVADNLIHYTDNKLEEKGEKPFLGVTIKVDKRIISYDEAKDKIVVSETLKVDLINAGSLASNYFILGDEIVSIKINDKIYLINRLFQIGDILLKVRKDDDVIFNVLRNGEEVGLNIIFKESDFVLID